MSRKTKAQRESEANYDAAVNWLISRLTLDIEHTFHAITQGWITGEEADRGVTEDGRNVDEVIDERRSELRGESR